MGVTSVTGFRVPTGLRVRKRGQGDEGSQPAASERSARLRAAGASARPPQPWRRRKRATRAVRGVRGPASARLRQGSGEVSP